MKEIRETLKKYFCKVNNIRIFNINIGNQNKIIEEAEKEFQSIMNEDLKDCKHKLQLIIEELEKEKNVAGMWSAFYHDSLKEHEAKDKLIATLETQVKDCKYWAQNGINKREL